MESVAKKIADILICNHVADEQQKEIVVFGINSAIYKMLHLGVAVLIGILFGRVFDIIVFHLFYQKLRTYAGGHHAKASAVCFISSCCIAVGTLTFWRLCPDTYKTWCTVVSLAVSFPIIWLLAPVEAVNKPIDEVEARVYRRKARALLLIEATIIGSLYFVGIRDTALVGSTALFTLSIMLVSGKLTNIFSIVSKYTK